MLIWSEPRLHVYLQKGVNTHKCIHTYYQCVGEEVIPVMLLSNIRLCTVLLHTYISGLTFNLDSFLPPERVSAAAGLVCN